MDNDYKNIKKGKPQQQFYRPGSGPLKKSQEEDEKSEYQNVSNDPPRRGHGRQRGSNRGSFHKDSNRQNEDISNKLQSLNISQDDEQKKNQRSRKPEQQIYIPKNRNMTEREENNCSPFSDVQISEAPNRGSSNVRYDDSYSVNERLEHAGFNDSHHNHDVKSKRYSGHRRNAHEGNESARRDLENSHRTDNRQNSEPRNMSPPRKGNVDNNSMPRNRDTRSMESSAPRHIHHSNGGKPPSGRRNSAVGGGPEPVIQNYNTKFRSQNIESIPPRFRKKYLAESGQVNVEEGAQNLWDGNSLVFQGNSGYHYPNATAAQRSQTLPTRGRGRVREEDIERVKFKQMINSAPNFESGSDSRSSTPHAPLITPPNPNKQENTLMEKLMGQSLQARNRSSDRKDDTAKYNQSYRSHNTQDDNINRTDGLHHTPSADQSNGHSRGSDHLNDVHSNNREYPNAKLNVKNMSTENISKSNEKISNKVVEPVSLPETSMSSLIEQSKEITDWARETEMLNNLDTLVDNTPTYTPNIVQSEELSSSQRSNNDQRQNNGNRQGRGNNNRQIGGTEQKTEGRSAKSRKKNKRNSGVKKRNAGNRSSSRSSQKREQSCDTNRRRSERSERSDRSPHSQGHNRDIRDHYRDNKENVSHRDLREHLEKDLSKDGRGFHRGDHGDRWSKNFSRDNSRDRRCFSRTNSGDRIAPGSRTGSRERLHHYGGQQGTIHQPPPRTNIIDPEKIKLPPPPPPPALRNSRNQSRRDSWSGKGSRHASIESGVGEAGYSPPRGGGGGDSKRRRRRKDSDRHNRDRDIPPSSSSSANWRDEMLPVLDRHETDGRRGRNDSIGTANDRRHEGSVGKCLTPGILVLPPDMCDKSRGRDNGGPHQNRGSSQISGNSPQGPTFSRTLYDHRNPGKPILVSQTAPPPSRLQESPAPIQQHAESHSGGRPVYYDTSSDSFRSSHNQDLLRDVERVDLQLQWIFKNGTMEQDWDKVMKMRIFLQHSLRTLLSTDVKFCQSENVEHHFWKMLYYNIIELMRKTMAQDESVKTRYTDMINVIIKDGNAYFENLLELLQSTYNFKLDDFLNAHHISPPKGLGFVGLALISAQKIYIFLGDLARYKELVNDTSNYAKSKNWYTKANQINPKNGRPYNQLAILAVYARRKLDAVYFYMRSLMSSNPFHSARESLIAMFDENRKKYEATERKRQAERQRAVEVIGGPRGLRREIWTRVGGGRTTTLLQADRLAARAALSDDEELSAMDSVELNKRFITSYLHVHGKLITKIGMETLSESATLMLRQFRALLRHSPLPINCGRLLQLTALNMFAIESAQLKENTSAIVGEICRSEVQERALAVSLRMFGALLERCCALLSAPVDTPRPRLPVHDDVIVILPAIKVWCEWMLSHSSVWNPPPPCDDFDIGGETDPWPKLAKLMNLLEPLELQRDLLKSEPSEDLEVVRLPEDTQLAGFTPLMYCAPETIYAPRTLDPESAKLAVRAGRLLFFGTVYLCGLDPPALERRLAAPDRPEYVSVVRRRQPDDERDASRERRDSSGDSDIMEASMSEEEDNTAEQNDSLTGSKTNWAAEESNDEQTKKLLRSRGQLEHMRRDLEKRRLRMQALLRQGQVSVELEVRPHYLVPDTNCFIDHLPRLQRLIAPDAGTPYVLVVPLVVVSELEGLTRADRVGEAAAEALKILHVRRPTVKFTTTRGNLLSTATFTAEQDADPTMKNDDRILVSSLSICRPNLQHQMPADDAEDVTNSGAVDAGSSSSNNGDIGPDGVKRLVREVVLLTDDRNLRVKALARDLPVRDLPAFMRWAAIE